MSKEREGHKVCFETAQNIRTLVKQAISGFERIPKNVASTLRNDAKADSKFHREIDKEFKYGNGPAVQER